MAKIGGKLIKSTTYRRLSPQEKALNKKFAIEFQLITTAYHEAGHCIMGLLNYMRIISVVLKADHKKDYIDESGCTNVIYDDPDQIDCQEYKQKLIIGEILYNYAGLAAEKLLYKDICGTEAVPFFVQRGSHFDKTEVSKIIKKYNLAPPGAPRYSFKKRMFNQSQKQLLSYWDDVKLIAHSLLKLKKIEFDELKKILLKKSNQKTFWRQHFKKII